MEKFNKILSRIVLTLFLLTFVICFAFAGLFFVNLIPVDSNSSEKIEFKIEAGWGKNKIADELEKNNLIKKAFYMKLYMKMNDTKTFIPGTFSLSKSMSVDEIIKTLTTSTPKEEETVSITFIEGKRFPYYVKKISSNYDITENDIMRKTSDKEYLNKLIKKYWFITEDILNEKIYYPLEGYLFPDTYMFKKNSNIEEILGTMLDGMNAKLEPYKETIINNKINVHELLTMASLVELEAVNAEDRSILVGVFNNRIKLHMTLGSDVTTYYAAKKELTQSLTKSDLNDCNAYNTRGTCVKDLPVGPIACVSLSSINASINPTTNEYLYFVADTKNKLYFAKDERGHINNINHLKSIGLWPE